MGSQLKRAGTRAGRERRGNPGKMPGKMSIHTISHLVDVSGLHLYGSLPKGNLELMSHRKGTCPT